MHPLRPLQGVSPVQEGLRPVPVWGCTGRRTPCTGRRLTIK